MSEEPSVRRLWALAMPLLVAGLTQIIVNIVDTVLLARSSTQALGAFALAAPIYLIALVIVRGWATAVQIMVARGHGAGTPGAVARVVRVGLIASAGAGVAIGAILYLIAEPALTVLGASAELIGPGTGYLRVLAFAVPFAAASFTLQSACAGVGVTRATMYNAVLVNVVNLPLGLLLIFTAGLGVLGAAVATLAATAVGTVFLLLYARARLPRETREEADAAGVMRGLWRIGWPEMSAMGVGYLNEALLAGFAARMGTPELAAYRIVDNLLLIVFTVMNSAAAAITIRAGHELGARDPARAERWRRTGVRLLLIVYAVPAGCALVLGRPLLSLVTGDAHTAGLAWQAVPLALVSMAPMVYAMAYGCFLRATGDTRSVMVANVTGDYLVLIPLGWFLGVHAGLGLPGLYVAWIAFSVVLTVVLFLRARLRLRRELALV
ncbi:MATE family efflux transporter [Spongiactinospora sp. TRM90649]|uniref:MATE family efflux transporter n=1 Tax=Spongiactinospora sp. TRM90649 TaxID=3031114 RepID=UPI0023F72971|nr:MATE family efflux transporter [Spongiactinospora sp. TRM90649]MDF5752785.1 MATE family efflux transporter [Spongiactinospora sp. TRM90649]